MKCPKCGFNSFEYYDSCKKCSNDLTGYKQTYSINSTVLPLEAKEKMAAAFCSSECEVDQVVGNTEAHGDIFSFDLPEGPSNVSAQQSGDRFNSNGPVLNIERPDGQKPDDDIFADLLETSSQSESSDPAHENDADNSTGAGEFDLEDFSWDNSPAAPTAKAAPDNIGTTDDFDSLFGEMKENTSK